MALKTHADGYIPDGILENHLALIRERGLNAGDYADNVEPESRVLADAIRAHADDTTGERADADLLAYEKNLAKLEHRPRAAKGYVKSPLTHTPLIPGRR
jgi:hypothetical protein